VFDKAWNAVRNGMQRGGAQIAGEMRAHVQTALKGKTVANSIRHKVYARKRNELPSLQIKSKVPWLRVHETGRTISGKLLIPLGSKRMRKDKWQKFLDDTFSQGRGFFRKIRGKTILFVRPDHRGRSDGLAKPRSSYRQRLSGQAGKKVRIARDRPIPVAVLVTRVTIKKRLRTEQIVRRGLQLITRGARAG
jgi:hypothetical protein